LVRYRPRQETFRPERNEYTGRDGERESVESPEVAFVDGEIAMETLRVFDSAEYGTDLQTFVSTIRLPYEGQVELTMMPTQAIARAQASGRHLRSFQVLGYFERRRTRKIRKTKQKMRNEIS
jgi:hypothetical protein